jgi:hypothetical protein
MHGNHEVIPPVYNDTEFPGRVKSFFAIAAENKIINDNIFANGNGYQTPTSQYIYTCIIRYMHLQIVILENCKISTAIFCPYLYNYAVKFR